MAVYEEVKVSLQSWICCGFLFPKQLYFCRLPGGAGHIAHGALDEATSFIQYPEWLLSYIHVLMSVGKASWVRAFHDDAEEALEYWLPLEVFPTCKEPLYFSAEVNEVVEAPCLNSEDNQSGACVSSRYLFYIGKYGQFHLGLCSGARLIIELL